MCCFCLWPSCHRLLGDDRLAADTFPRSWGRFCSHSAASKEIICLSIPGFMLNLRFWERPCSRKRMHLSSAILRGDRPKPSPHNPNQCHPARCQLIPTVSQPEPPKQRKCFPTLAQGIPHFLPQEACPSMAGVSQSLVWRPPPPVHMGLVGPLVSVLECLLPATCSTLFPGSGPKLTGSKNCLRCSLHQSPH